MAQAYGRAHWTAESASTTGTSFNADTLVSALSESAGEPQLYRRLLAELAELGRVDRVRVRIGV